MTIKQIDLYFKLRRKLKRYKIKNIPTALKVHEIDNQKGFMILKVLQEEIKNLEAWEFSSSFRNSCFDKYGSDFNIISKVEEEINNVLIYAEFQR